MDGAERAGSTDTIVRDLLLSGVDEAYRLATRILHDRLAAQDAVQEAALRAWESRASLRDPDTAAAWFTKIVVNVCRDELRRRGRKPRVVPLALTTDPSQTDGSAHSDELSRPIARLKPDEQVLLGLRFGRDLTVGQIATYLGVPEGTVKSRLHSSVAHLRAALDAERRAPEVI